MRVYYVWTILVVAAVFAAQDASAQFGGGFPGGGGMRGGMRRGGQSGTRSVMPQRPVTPEIIDEQLGLLEEALNLTQAQWPAWQRYADQVRALSGDVDRERRRAELAEKENAVQQLDHASDALRNRLTALEDIAGSARALYGTLTPEQQTVANGRLSGVVLRLVGVPQPGIGDRTRNTASP